VTDVSVEEPGDPAYVLEAWEKRSLRREVEEDVRKSERSGAVLICERDRRNPDEKWPSSSAVRTTAILGSGKPTINGPLSRSFSNDQLNGGVISERYVEACSRFGGGEFDLLGGENNDSPVLSAFAEQGEPCGG
jgi:hypothetical protein